MAFPVFFDTGAIFGIYLSDTLLRFADEGIFQPLWSAGVLDELSRNLLGIGVAEEAAAYRIAQMTAAFPDAAVTGYERLVDTMVCDEKDRHVLAAACSREISSYRVIALRQATL